MFWERAAAIWEKLTIGFGMASLAIFVPVAAGSIFWWVMTGASIFWKCVMLVGTTSIIVLCLNRLIEKFFKGVLEKRRKLQSFLEFVQLSAFSLLAICVSIAAVAFLLSGLFRFFFGGPSGRGIDMYDAY